MLLTGNPSQGKKQTLPQSERLETIFQANSLKKQAGVAILVSNKINFQLKVIKKDKEGHFIHIKGKILQEELSILNIYAPNARAATLIKDTLVKLKAHIAPHNNSGRLQHPTLTSGQILGAKAKQRHNETNRTYEINRFDRYL